MCNLPQSVGWMSGLWDIISVLHCTVWYQKILHCAMQNRDYGISPPSKTENVLFAKPQIWSKRIILHGKGEQTKCASQQKDLMAEVWGGGGSICPFISYKTYNRYQFIETIWYICTNYNRYYFTETISLMVFVLNFVFHFNNWSINQLTLTTATTVG